MRRIGPFLDDLRRRRFLSLDSNSAALLAELLTPKVRAFLEDRAREQIAHAPNGSKPDVRTWQEDESPYARVAEGLSDRGIADTR